MKVAPAGLALALLLSAPVGADAQAVVLVVDAGPVRLNVDALRAQIGEATGRTLLRLGDEGSREATETLAIVRAGAQRWVIRYQRGDLTSWSEPNTLRPGALRQTLTEAAALVLRETPAAPDPEPVAEERPPSWDHGNDPGRDLVDPFVRRRWDPLREVLAGELHHPFSRGGATPVCFGIVDPFLPTGPSLDLFDPWTAR